MNSAAAQAAEQERGDDSHLRGDLRTLGRRLSHDFRSPLNAIYIAADALKRGASDPGSPQAKLAGSILGAVDELVMLADRIGFVLRATADPLPRQTLSMKEIVWKALLQLEHRSGRSGATIGQPESWPMASGVSPWLEVIWWNLIANAVEHGGEKPRIQLGWDREDLSRRFWVRDGGPGVPPAERERLFQPFHTMHELNAPRGLGLSIVRRLVDLQGGRCGYEPAPGGGSVFFFTLSG